MTLPSDCYYINAMKWLLLLILPLLASGLSIRWSRDNQRGSSMLLEGTINGLQMFVFVPDEGQISIVEFFLDKTVASGSSPSQTEKKSPYDLLGTASGAGRPLNTINLDAGQHFVEVRVTYDNGGQETARADFTIPAIPNGPDSLLEVSTTSDRAGNVKMLDGYSIPAADNAYIFIDGSEMGDRGAQFFMDRSSGDPDRTDTVTPFDLVGEAGDGSALVLDKSSLSTGMHTLTVYLEGDDNKVLKLTAMFHLLAGGSTSATLMVSGNADRSSAVPLTGAVLQDTSYVFLGNDGDVDVAAFYLNKPTTGSADQTEKQGPFDFAGTASNGNSGPWDLSSANDGTNIIRVVITKLSGGTVEISATFTVGSDSLVLMPSSIAETVIKGSTRTISVQVSSPGQLTDVTASNVPSWATVTPSSGITSPGSFSILLDTSTVPVGSTVTAAVTFASSSSGLSVSLPLSLQALDSGGSTDATLMVSGNADRSSAVPLTGAVLQDTSYVFLGNDGDVDVAAFYLNKPTTGSADQTEKQGPFDFAGTASNGNSGPWDLSSANDGMNIIRVVITKLSGGTVEISATFTVGSDSLVLMPSSIAETVIKGSTRTISVQVSSPGQLTDVTASNVPSWATVTPSSGITSPGSFSILLDTSTVPVGSTVTAAVTFASSSSGLSVSLPLSLQALDSGGSTDATLMVSGNADRSSAVPLTGAVLQDTSYVFLGNDGDVDVAAFYLNKPTTGSADQTEKKGPFDFAGTASNGNSGPWDLSSANDGTNIIRVVITKLSGGTVEISATFTVGSDSLVLMPSSIAETVIKGSTRTISVQVSSPGQLTDVTASNVPSWATVTPSSGITSPGSFSILLDTSTVPVGSTVTAAVTFASSSSGLSVSLPLSLQALDSSALLLGVSPTSLDMIGKPDTGDTAAVITITAHSAAPTATYSLTCDESWLSWTISGPANPTATQTILADTNGLAEGTYTATCVLSAPQYADVTIPVTLVLSPNNCLPVVCADIKVDVPHSITFSQNNGGELRDKNGVGTGFTYMFPHKPGSGTALDAYIPQNLEVDMAKGELHVEATPGIEYKTNNNANNLLSFGFAAPNQLTYLSTWVMQPYYSNTNGNFEQAGVFFGIDQNNYAKVVWTTYKEGGSTKYALMMVVEEDGEILLDEKASVLNRPEFSYQVRILVDPFEMKVFGDYSLNGVLWFPLGEVSNVPGEWFSFDAAGIDPIIGTRSFGGITASRRHNSQTCIFRFKDFHLKVGERPPPEVDFEFTKKSINIDHPTNMAFGPDGRLYVTVLFGDVYAVTYDNSLNAVDIDKYTTLPDDLGDRLTLGIAVDPRSTANDIILWLAHSSPQLRGGGLNSGMVSMMRGSKSGGFNQISHPVKGLPRAEADHAPNSLHFKNGKLYLSVGGNTGAGGAIREPSDFGKREEQWHSAALLELDVLNSNFDGMCYQNGQNPFGRDTGCDVKNWATGLRNSYDFVFHSNGQVYATDNGLGGACTGAFPVRPTPPCFGFASVDPVSEGGQNPLQQTDLLYNVKKGKFYGHGNPARDECVYKDGSYQGVDPHPNFDPFIADLGMHASANGIIEYTGGSNGCPVLVGDLLHVRYSSGDDIRRVELSADGLHATKITTVAFGFNDPLAIRQNTKGDLFVAEHGGGRITSLRFKNC